MSNIPVKLSILLLTFFTSFEPCAKELDAYFIGTVDAWLEEEVVGDYTHRVNGLFIACNSRYKASAPECEPTTLDQDTVVILEKRPRWTLSHGRLAIEFTALGKLYSSRLINTPRVLTPIPKEQRFKTVYIPYKIIKGELKLLGNPSRFIEICALRSWLIKDVTWLERVKVDTTWPTWKAYLKDKQELAALEQIPEWKECGRNLP